MSSSLSPDGLEIWHVSADIRPEGGEVVSHVGDIEIVFIDPDETRDAFSLLDGESGDLGVIGGAILDLTTGGLDPELDERLEPFGSRILILNRAQLAEEWRGFGIGVLLAGVAIKRLSAGCRAAVCYPAPIGPNAPDHDDEQRQMAVVPSYANATSTPGSLTWTKAARRSVEVGATNGCPPRVGATSWPTTTMRPNPLCGTPSDAAGGGARRYHRTG